MLSRDNHDNENQSMQAISIVVLGASGVGKSSIVHQFIYGDFSDDYNPTQTRAIHYTSAVINDHLYDIKIFDCPRIASFPATSMQEFSNYRNYGLRSASAYILVYDVTLDRSIRHVVRLRDQIASNKSTNDVPLIFAGNKYDLLPDRQAMKRSVGNFIKKQWKCFHVECSAKYNWRITALLREVLKAVDHKRYGQRTHTVRVQEAFRNNNCIIL